MGVYTTKGNQTQQTIKQRKNHSTQHCNQSHQTLMNRTLVEYVRDGNEATKRGQLRATLSNPHDVTPNIATKQTPQRKQCNPTAVKQHNETQTTQQATNNATKTPQRAPNNTTRPKQHNGRQSTRIEQGRKQHKPRKWADPRLAG